VKQGSKEVNKPTAIIAAFIFAMTLVSSTGVRAESDDEASIRALESRFVAAVNAKDVNAIMKVYVADESLFVFDVIPPRQYVGAEAYAKDWTDFLALFKGSLKLKISDLSVTADGTMGFGHSIQRVTGSDTKGHPVDLTVRVTDVYRKISGNWLIVHEHISVPVDLDTGKPDLSSKP
jgi:ketosteroid isomerase-like protein